MVPQDEFLSDILGESNGSPVAVADPPTPKVDAPAPAQAADAKSARSAKSRKSQPLFLDLETIPDTSRIDAYDLPPIPLPAVYMADDEGPTPSELIKATVDETKAAVAAAIAKNGGKLINAKVAEACIEIERKAAKPRKGVVEIFADMVAAFNGEAQAIADVITARNKTMSVAPEMCKVVAMGWAIGNDPIQSMVVGAMGPDGKTPITEADILVKFWSLLGNCGPVCGYNVLGFDLPVLFVRSAELGVKPTKKIDLKPWGNDVIDLMAIRFPKAGAKSLDWMIRVNGIESECPDVDGSKVLGLYEAGELEKIGEYVSDDVSIERELWRKYLGFFW